MKKRSSKVDRTWVDNKHGQGGLHIFWCFRMAGRRRGFFTETEEVSSARFWDCYFGWFVNMRWGLKCRRTKKDTYAHTKNYVEEYTVTNWLLVQRLLEAQLCFQNHAPLSCSRGLKMMQLFLALSKFEVTSFASIHGECGKVGSSVLYHYVDSTQHQACFVVSTWLWVFDRRECAWRETKDSNHIKHIFRGEAP